VNRAYLVLEDGSIFEGESFGATGETLGELVFATGMTGYQETITDPSYAGQIVLQTAPHIGIVGMNKRDEESKQIWVAGYVVKEPSRVSSNWRAESTLDTELKKAGVIGIADIDTRAITLRIRDRGAMRAGIFSGRELDSQAMLDKVQSSARMSGQFLSHVVSTNQVYRISPSIPKVGTVAVLDLGVKKSTLEHLADRGLEVIVFPATASAREILEHKPDGIFYSNGPGDPQASDAQVDVLRELLELGLPFFGICFGNQLLGRALGFSTYKLAFGHRGINQPVLNTVSGRVEVTAHNHGFAVQIDGDETVSPLGFGRVRVSHRALNDGVVEGLECLDLSAFSVQYHPEAAAGPHDSHYLFDKFLTLIGDRRA
jgi:carbamoyl-phosphate synthase small subunit